MQVAQSEVNHKVLKFRKWSHLVVELAQNSLKRFSTRLSPGQRDSNKTLIRAELSSLPQVTHFSDQNLVLCGAVKFLRAAGAQSRSRTCIRGLSAGGITNLLKYIREKKKKEKKMSTTLCCLKLGSTYSSGNQQIHLGSLREGLRRGERRLQCGLLVVAPHLSGSTPVRAGVCGATV